MLAQLVCLMAVMAGISHAEIIDRIAVTIDTQVITESEILREIRLTAFLNGEPVDVRPEARKKAAERLIEQKLIRKETTLGRYAQPAPADAQPLLKQVRTQRFTGDADYRQSLEKYDLAEDDLVAHLLWQLTLLRFIDTRFRPGVQVTDEAVAAYFEQHRAELEKGAGTKLTLDDVREQIQQILAGQLADQQLDAWLADTRRRARIEFLPEAFQ